MPLPLPVPAAVAALGVEKPGADDLVPRVPPEVLQDGQVFAVLAPGGVLERQVTLVESPPAVDLDPVSGALVGPVADQPRQLVERFGGGFGGRRRVGQVADAAQQ